MLTRHQTNDQPPLKEWHGPNLNDNGLYEPIVLMATIIRTQPLLTEPRLYLHPTEPRLYLNPTIVDRTPDKFEPS